MRCPFLFLVVRNVLAPGGAFISQEIIMFTFNIEYRNAAGGVVHSASGIRASAPEAIKRGLETASDVQRRQVKLTIMRKVRGILFN